MNKLMMSVGCAAITAMAVATETNKFSLVANNLPLLIGYDPFGEPEYFIGDMDDVRLFNRALSEKEIQELYKAEAPNQ